MHHCGACSVWVDFSWFTTKSKSKQPLHALEHDFEQLQSKIMYHPANKHVHVHFGVCTHLRRVGDSTELLMVLVESTTKSNPKIPINWYFGILGLDSPDFKLVVLVKSMKYFGNQQVQHLRRVVSLNAFFLLSNENINWKSCTTHNSMKYSSTNLLKSLLYPKIMNSITNSTDTRVAARCHFGWTFFVFPRKVQTNPKWQTTIILVDVKSYNNILWISHSCIYTWTNETSYFIGITPLSW